MNVNNIDLSGTRKKTIVIVSSNLKENIVSREVELKIPLPEDALDVEFTDGTNSFGKFKFSEESLAVIWTFREFYGQTEHDLTFTYWVPTVRERNTQMFESKPVEVSFEVKCFTVSGIQIRYLKVINETDYDAVSWVRYLTRNGEYCVRVK